MRGYHTLRLSDCCAMIHPVRPVWIAAVFLLGRTGGFILLYKARFSLTRNLRVLRDAPGIQPTLSALSLSYMLLTWAVLMCACTCTISDNSGGNEKRAV